MIQGHIWDGKHIYVMSENKGYFRIKSQLCLAHFGSYKTEAKAVRVALLIDKAIEKHINKFMEIQPPF